MIRRLSTLSVIAIWAVMALSVSGTPTPSRAPRSNSQGAAETPLLDAYPDAYAAYSLRQLRSDYTGPAIRVRRGNDGAEQDIGFTASGKLDTEAIEAFVGSGDGYVAVWYSQMRGAPDLTNATPSDQPLVAEGGTLITDRDGQPALYFDGDSGDGDYDFLEASDAPAMAMNDYTFLLVGAVAVYRGEETIAGAASGGHNRAYEGMGFRTNGQSYINTADARFADNTAGPLNYDTKGAFIIRNDGAEASLFRNHSQLLTIISGDAPAISNTNTQDGLFVGGGFEGTISEFLFYPALSTADRKGVYDNVNRWWNLGPTNPNEEAILPQQYEYQVTLYDWLETIDTSDVTLPARALNWDGSYADTDELADLWLQVRGLTASSVVRGEPAWYVLDAGNGKGIEATGSIKVWNEPRGSRDYGGNPPRSWSNEAAFLYHLDIPLSGGGQGNPYYHNPALGRRALIVAMVDMMMHHQNWLKGDPSGWYDMFGKASLAWAETYRWCKDLLPTDVQDAFETGMGYALDRMIEKGPRAVNTNMDMYAIQAQTEFYIATDDPALKQKAVQAAKRALFGYPDGELGVKHKVFKVGEGYDGGVFDPSGFIMEGDQPDIFYGGESIYHLMGALAAVTNRETEEVPSDWAFLEEVVRRLQEWRTYQYFYDPGVASPSLDGTRYLTVYHAGAGFAGRTGAGVPDGQAGEVWKSLAIADRFPGARFRAQDRIPKVYKMERDITATLNYITDEMGSVYTGEPPTWNGWSPWVKKTPYLPTEGWYSRLKSLEDTGDPAMYPPVKQEGVYYNKAFGGYPVGNQYWAYKQTDGTREWGFFVEAQTKQGPYGGWYGGKIETFWTETTGVILLNRHGKTGCDDGAEDSVCWDNLDSKAGHHVWGRDENGNGFTTLLLRGHELSRTSTFDLEASPPRVEVVNIFNDPSHADNPSSGMTGEETGSEIEGTFSVTNRFEAQPDGVTVTHTLSSDQTDQVTELWASIPVFLRLYNPLRVGDNPQLNLEDTTIEYWNGTSWQAMPEDTNADGVPEIVTTTALRLGRDYELGDGPQYAYVAMEGNQHVRLAKNIYHDPYQTKTRVRTVHIDLHGDPGTVKTLPAEKSVSYTIQTTDPTSSEGGSTSSIQDISLQEGWNVVSTSVAPNDLDMEAILTDVLSQIALVKDEAEQVFNPSDGTNQIGDWDLDEAYMIYAEAPVSLTMQGEPIDAGKMSITLNQGWNLIPYTPSTAMPIEEALASVAGELVLVKDETGRVYYPDTDVNTIGQMKPGEGYKVYVSQQVTLTYPTATN